MKQNYNQFLNCWDLFPSPPWVVELLVEKDKVEPVMHCLEPSAGFGGIVAAMQKLGGNVQGIEPLPQLQTILTLQGLLVIGSYFLTANTANSFQLFIQNSPFSQQIFYVKKAYQSFSYKGRIVSLVSNIFCPDNRSFYKQFRHWFLTFNAKIQELPWVLFVNSTRYTQVECNLITINKT